MKKILILTGLFLATVFAWGQTGDLTGIWINAEEEAFFAFIGNLCFIGDTDGKNYEVESAPLNYSYNSTVRELVLSHENEKLIFQATLRNNSLTISYEGETIVFTKRTDSPARQTIAGVWHGPSPWVFCFVNDQVFIIDVDGDADSGPYRMTGNRGSFDTVMYGWKFDFTVNGNTLIVDGDVKGNFTRRNR